jgi:hypothetical protein
MGDNSYSYYIRTRPCCSSTQTVSRQGPTGPTGSAGPYSGSGPTGPTGPTGPSETTNAILYFSDFTALDASSAYLDFDLTRTTNNGINNFMNGSETTSSITFENELITTNSYIEIYAHCDAEAGSAGQDNWVIMELSGNNLEPTPIDANSLSVVDIDTRSVQKGAKLHLSFGPSAYRITDTPTVSQNLTIAKTNKYRLYVLTGRAYTLTEIKLVIHLRQSN